MELDTYTFGMYPLSAMFDLERTIAKDYLLSASPWEVLANLGQTILRLGPTLGDDYREIAPTVWAHLSAHIAPDAVLTGPAILGQDATLRPHAYLRGSVLVGDRAMVGHGCEVKNSILFSEAAAAHFNYVGDSILGYRAHLGAGAILSNVRSNRAHVTLFLTPNGVQTSLSKLGALVGDMAEIGCGSVLNPGTVVGEKAVIYPLRCVKGHIPAGCLWRDSNA